jgi:hypothetical protein
VRNLHGYQHLGQDADYLRSAGERGIGHRAHQANARPSINQPQSGRTQGGAQCFSLR